MELYLLFLISAMSGSFILSLLLSSSDSAAPVNSHGTPASPPAPPAPTFGVVDLGL